MEKRTFERKKMVLREVQDRALVYFVQFAIIVRIEKIFDLRRSHRVSRLRENKESTNYSPERKICDDNVE
jgi:hypothetical protein